MPPVLDRRKGHRLEKIPQILRRRVEARERFPLGPVANSHVFLEFRHLVDTHETGVIVLVALKRHAEALDSVCHEALRPIFVTGLIESLEDGFHVVPRKVRHKGVQSVIVVIVKQCLQTRRAAQITLQVLAPGGAPFEGQR